MLLLFLPLSISFRGAVRCKGAWQQQLLIFTGYRKILVALCFFLQVGLDSIELPECPTRRRGATASWHESNDQSTVSEGTVAEGILDNGQ